MTKFSLGIAYDYQEYYRPTDSELLTLMGYLPNVTTIVLAQLYGATRLTDTGIAAVLDQLHKLATLEISNQWVSLEDMPISEASIQAICRKSP